MIERSFGLDFLQLFGNIILDFLLRGRRQPVHEVVSVEFGNFLMNVGELQFFEFPFDFDIVPMSRTQRTAQRGGQTIDAR